MIRRARSEDGVAIQRLALELAEYQEEWRVFPPREGFLDAVLSRYRRAMDSDDSRVLVAELDGQVVGMACVEVLVPSRFSDERAVELSGVYVDGRARRRGIGRELVAAAAAFGAERGVDRMVLHTFSGNDAAMGFWREVGFQERVVQFTARIEDLQRQAADPI